MGAKLPTTLLSRRPSTLGSSCSLLSSSSSSSASSTRTATAPSPTSHARQPNHQQVRHATFVPRPQRPYQFTQMIQLSDGSTYTARTTSPQALFRSTKDTRNHILWQPTERSLRNVEVDEAGRLAAFRERFGRGWDADVRSADAGMEERGQDGSVEVDGGRKGGKGTPAAADKGRDGAAAAAASADLEEPTDMLADLISGYAAKAGVTGAAPDRGLSAKEQAKRDRASAGKKK